ncbi:hypothetical protein [Spirosoma rigui]|uniref:hypothetical protein n=1 Tax=Spirosoma rigui TaxID=564064 RepID=UPI0009B0E5B3|nr:hypothetical protein [Spirosoma rigui]
MVKLLPMSAFFKLLQDAENDGFSIKYRKTDGKSGQKHDCRKSRKRFEGRGNKKGAGLRYDVFEKGVLLLEDASGNVFSLRTRLITHYRFKNDQEWHRIKRSW